MNGRFVYLRLMVLVLIWAANWSLVKTIFDYISPSSFVLWRFCGAPVVLAAIMLARRQRLLPARDERTRLAIIGILQIALCLGISTLGLGYVGAGRAAVLMYTMQLWVLPLGWMLAGERITRMALIGALGIFSGLVLFMNPGLVNWHDSKTLFGNALLLISALCWALGACLYRRYKWRTPFWSQAFWQILWSGIVIAIAVPVLGPRRPVVWNGAVIGVLVYNWLGATALCYALWGKVLTVMPASRAGQFLSLTPVVAVLISSALTGEALTASAIVSVFLVAGGICLAAWKK
jgi:drug/metabolite transporter (DMT)-like permease